MLISAPPLLPFKFLTKYYQESLSEYFGDRKNPKERAGYFIRRSQNIKSFLVSKCVDQVKDKEPRNHIMM